MTVPASTIEQMQNLQEEQMSVIIRLVDFYSQSSADVFDRICEEELQTPLSSDVIDEAISNVRQERYERAASN